MPYLVTVCLTNSAFDLLSAGFYFLKGIMQDKFKKKKYIFIVLMF